MVRLNLWVRPKPGYSSPNKLQRIQVDSSERVEDIVSKLKLEKKGTYFYANGRELPMNSSIASHNIHDGTVLETCNGPALSTVLSAVLKDLNQVDKLSLEDRDEAHVRPLLDTGVRLDPWPDRWAPDDIQSRVIALATMKKILQRDGRFENETIPYCADLQSLINFLPAIWNRDPGTPGGRRRNGHNTMAHIVKPTSRNRNGQPTTCWELLQNKLDKLNRISTELTAVPAAEDPIEIFLQRDSARHGTSSRGNSRTQRVAGTPATPAAARPRRNLSLTPTPSRVRRRSQATVVACASCTTVVADSVCLHAECPFYQQLCCTMCFHGNHPVLQRCHPCIPLTDPRAKALLKERTRSPYVPEYKSGPYCILLVLYHYSHLPDATTREYSLAESRLKKLAQEFCRSNLYDSQARGRNAFACVESLTAKGFLRKEIIPGSSEAKFSLLPTGEVMGQRCYEFDQPFQRILVPPSMQSAKARVLTAPSQVQLVIDNREDATYIQRLQERCQDATIPYDQRELPAGDYLFSIARNDQEHVLPLLVERKTWSDLADSVHGRGQGKKRLDCLRIDTDGLPTNACRGGCQLCRMKQSGCQKILFIIEGARCLQRDQDFKCSEDSRCKYCRELMERHGGAFVQEKLETVLHTLQIDHNCLVVFTRGFNESVDALFCMREILACSPNLQQTTDLSYPQFCTNARRRILPLDDLYQRPKLIKGPSVVVQAESFLRSVRQGSIQTFLGDGSRSNRVLTFTDSTCNRNDIIAIDDEEPPVRKKARASRTSPNQEIVLCDDSDRSNDAHDDADLLVESQDTILVLEDTGWTNNEQKSSRKAPAFTRKTQQTSVRRKQPPATANESPCIAIDSDSGSDSDGIEIIGTSPSKSSARTRQRAVSDDDDSIEVVESPTPAASTTRKRRRPVQQNLAASTTSSSNQTQLFLVQGIYEYDRDFWDDTNKVWKAIYQEHDAAATGDTPFERKVEQRLQQLGWHDNHDCPLVPRSMVLFWYLYVQIQGNARLQMMRTTTEMEAFQRRWSGDTARAVNAPALPIDVAAARRTQTSRPQRAEPAAAYAVTASVAATPTTASAIEARHRRPLATEARTPARRALVFEGTPTCMICEALIPEPELFETPCHHVFHIMCISVWMDGSSTRKCPSCNQEGIGLPKRARSAPTPPQQLAPRPPTTAPRRARAATVQDNVREARLRRFEQTSTATTTPAAISQACAPITARRASKRTWKCTQCTLDNPIGASKCTVCNQAKPVPSDSQVGIWNCDQCTLENPTDSPKCIACNTANPLFICSDATDPCSVTDPTGFTTVPPLASAGAMYTPNPVVARRPPVDAIPGSVEQQQLPQVKKVTCGACRQQGHNRTSATAINCPMFNDPSEVARREQKKVEAEERARQKREEAARFATETNDDIERRTALQMEMQRMLQQQMTTNEELQRMRREEIKRRQKAAERAEKRAQRLAR